MPIFLLKDLAYARGEFVGDELLLGNIIMEEIMSQ